MKRKIVTHADRSSRVKKRWYLLVGHLEGEEDQVWRGQASSISAALQKFIRRLTSGSGADVLMTAAFSAAAKPAVLFDGIHWRAERQASSRIRPQRDANGD